MRILGILIVLLLVYDNTRVDAIRAFRSSLRRNEDALAADRSEESDSTSTQASADADLVGSLKDLLTSHQEREKHEQSRLEEVITNNNKLQEELMHKKAELANHAALMAQLEQCLQQTSLVTLGSNAVSTAATTQQAAAGSSPTTPPSSGDAMAGLGGSALPNAAVVPGAAGAVANAAQIVDNGPATIVTESAPSTLPTSLYPSASDVNGGTNNNAGSSPTSLLDTRQHQDSKQPVAPPTHFKMVPHAEYDTAHSIDMWMKASPEQLSAKVKELVEREAAMSRAEADFKSKQSLLIQQQEAFKTQLKTAQGLKLGTTPPLSGHTFNPAIIPAGADSFLQKEIGSDIDPAVLRQQIELPPSLRHHPSAPLPFQQHRRLSKGPPRTREREYITPSFVMAEMKARAAPLPLSPTPAAFLDMGETAWRDTRITTDDRSHARLTARVPICVQYTNCTACSADPNCAWCYQPIPVDANVTTSDLVIKSGVCMAHNVNFMQQGSVTAADLHNEAFLQRKRANIMGGGGEVMQLTDALMLGQCLAGQWSSSLTGDQPTFLSFNVFADDENEGTTRVDAIAALILAMSPIPHVVAFQEAEGWFVECLRKNTALMAVFLYQSNYGDNIAPGGLFILSRKPLTDINYIEKVAPGQNRIDQRPRMLIASVNFDGRDVWVANTCLDWRSSDSRVDALNFIFTTLSPFRDVVLMGDFNFDEGAPDETAHIPFCDGWVDTWTQVNSGLDGHTWDPSSTGNGTYVNSYAHQADPNSQPSRIDRIFLKSTNLKTASMSMVGSSVTSTHFGLLLKAYLFLSQCPA